MNRLRISWICCALFLALSLSASAQPDWTRVGSTGTIDEASLGAYATSTGASLHHLGASLVTVTARYNVDNVSGLFPLAPWNTLEMTSLDGTTQGHVTATLFRLPRCGSLPVVVCTVQSNDVASGPVCTQCTFGAPLDFANNSYFVQVNVTRSVTTVLPTLYNLRLW